MPKKTPIVRTKKGDEALAPLMSPGVMAKVKQTASEKAVDETNKGTVGPNLMKDIREEEKATEVDFESLIGAAFIAIGLGILIGLAFAFIMRDGSAVEVASESLGLADMIPQ